MKKKRACILFFYIKRVPEFTQNREKECYKSISSPKVFVFSAPTLPPHLHTHSPTPPSRSSWIGESVTELNHVGRRAPFRIQGRCRSLQDLSSAGRNHPQKRLHRHQGSSLQGIRFFIHPPLSLFLFFLWCCIISFDYHVFSDDCGFGHD